MSTAEYVLPAGTLLSHLDQIAAALDLTRESDDALRSLISAERASSIVRKLADDSFELEPTDGNWNTFIASSIMEFQNELLYPSGNIFSCYVSKRAVPSSTLECTCSVIHVMELIDEFSTKCGLGRLGDQELKFGVPIDHLSALLTDLYRDRNFSNCPERDIYVVSRCRRLRFGINLDLSREPLLNIVRLNRGASIETPSGSENSFLVEANRFTESFPLHQRSVLKYSGPELVLVLSLTAIEGIIDRWLRQFPNVKRSKYIEASPFDCVVRAIRAHPNSLTDADQLIKDSMCTKGRFNFSSLKALRDRIIQVTEHNQLSRHIEQKLFSEISATYSFLLVFREIDKRDSLALSKGGKWISLGRLRIFETPKQLPDIRDFTDSGANCQISSKTHTFDV